MQMKKKEREDNICRRIIIVAVNLLDGIGEEGIVPKSSKVKLLANVLSNNSASEEGKLVVVPSEETRTGKEEEIFFCRRPEKLLLFLPKNFF